MPDWVQQTANLLWRSFMSVVQWRGTTLVNLGIALVVLGPTLVDFIRKWSQSNFYTAAAEWWQASVKPGILTTIGISVLLFGVAAVMEIHRDHTDLVTANKVKQAKIKELSDKILDLEAQTSRAELFYDDREQRPHKLDGAQIFLEPPLPQGSTQCRPHVWASVANAPPDRFML